MAMRLRSKRMTIGLAAWVWVAASLTPADDLADAGPVELFAAGRAHFAGGRYEPAAAAFQTLLDRFGREPALREQLEAVYYGLGCSLFNLARYDEAIEAFKPYVERYPEAAFRDEGLFRMALAHHLQERLEPALQGYRQLIEAYPRSSFAEDAAYQIGETYRALGQRPQAAEAYAFFCRTFPESSRVPQATLHIARAQFEQDQKDEALATATRLDLANAPLTALVYANFLIFEIGDAAYEETDYDLALDAYRRIRPRRFLIEAQTRYVENVEQQLNRLRASPIDPARARERFRDEQRLAQDFAEARDLQQRLNETPDYDAALYHRVGRCFFNIDRFWEARAAYRRVVHEADDEKLREAAHFDLTLVMARMRRFDDLLGEADRYLERYDR